MSDLVVIAFPTEAKAEEVRQKPLAMQKEYLIELGDAAAAPAPRREGPPAGTMKTAGTQVLLMRARAERQLFGPGRSDRSSKLTVGL